MNEYLEDIVNRIAEQINDLKDGGSKRQRTGLRQFSSWN